MEDTYNRPEKSISQMKIPEQILPSSNVSDIHTGMTFSTWNEFAERYECFLKREYHPVFVVESSYRAQTYNQVYPKSAMPLACGYKFMFYECAHGKPCKSSPQGQRPKQYTQRKSCNAHLVIKYSRMKKILEITKCDFNHCNDDGTTVHEVNQDLFERYKSQQGFRGINYTIARVKYDINKWIITKEKPEAKPAMDNTKLLVKYGTKVQNVRGQFETETGIPIATKTLAYQKQKMQLNDLNILLNNEKFLKELHKDESNGEIILEKVKNNNNEIQLIYFQFQWMKEMFDKYPEHILMDGTYSLVDTRMPLYTIMIVDGNNISVPVAFSLISQETNYLLDCFLSFFVKHNPTSIDQVESYMTDKDFKEMTVLAKYFPNAKHELCLYHVLSSMRTMINKSDLPKRSKDYAREKLEKMVFSRSSEQFETLAEEFQTKFEGHQLKTDFVSRWYSIKNLWAGYIRQITLNFGDTTNNRIESFNHKLKTYINRYSNIYEFYKQLKLFMSHTTEKIKTGCFDEQSKQSSNAFSNIDKEIVAIIDKTATHYAGEIMKKQIEKISEVKIKKFNSYWKEFSVTDKSGNEYWTSYDLCSCPSFVTRNIPCKHIFHVRITTNKPVFEPSLLSVRWRKSYFVNACQNAFSSASECENTKNVNTVPITHMQTSSTKEILPTSIKVCGRPKGSHLTVIGRLRILPKPSERKKRRILPALPTSQGFSAASINVLQPVKVNPCEEQAADEQLWLKIDNYRLYTRHKHCLLGDEWLDDEMINSAQSMLKRQHGLKFEGLQDTILTQTASPYLELLSGQWPFVQICHVTNNHWVCIAGAVEPNSGHVVLNIYDSLSRTKKEPYKEVISVVSSMTRHFTNSKIEVRQHNVTQQIDGYNCGVFAIAFAKFICMELNPCKFDIIQPRLRPNLYESFMQYSSTSEMLPFQAKPNYRNKCEKWNRSMVDKVYCICRKEAKNVMTLCARCKEQFHLKCLEDKGVEVQTPFYCERCTAFL